MGIGNLKREISLLQRTKYQDNLSADVDMNSIRQKLVYNRQVVLIARDKAGKKSTKFARSVKPGTMSEVKKGFCLNR